jgi:hypothetical protein
MQFVSGLAFVRRWISRFKPFSQVFEMFKPNSLVEESVKSRMKKLRKNNGGAFGGTVSNSLAKKVEKIMVTEA